jgi:hypothetical protein
MNIRYFWMLKQTLELDSVEFVTNCLFISQGEQVKIDRSLVNHLKDLIIPKLNNRFSLLAENIPRIRIM